MVLISWGCRMVTWLVAGRAGGLRDQNCTWDPEIFGKLPASSCVCFYCISGGSQWKDSICPNTVRCRTEHPAEAGKERSAGPQP